MSSSARAADVAALLDQVGSIRWLRPSGPRATEAHLAELVAAHYAGLADYSPAPRPLPRIVRQWHEARDLFGAMLPYYEGFLCTHPAVRAVCRVIEGTTLEGAFRVPQPVVNRAAFFRMYDALWRAASAGTATGVKALPVVEAMLSADPEHNIAVVIRSVDALSSALGAAYALTRHAAWETAHGVFANTPDAIPEPLDHFAGAVDAGHQAAPGILRTRPIHPPGCSTCAELPAARDRLVRTYLEVTTQVVDRMATMAGRLFGWQVAYLLQAEERRDPWRPLVDLWRLGACAVDCLGNTFVVFVPERTN